MIKGYPCIVTIHALLPTCRHHIRFRQCAWVLWQSRSAL